ncbi:MAG: coproporphyrinogen-III oxidase family protein [Synechococcaceae cyanobacterium]
MARPRQPLQPRPPRSAYVHLPFCHRRCFYCDFPVVPLGDRADGERSGSIAAYLELLLSEIAHAPQGPPLATVYFGGGTPSLLSPAQIGRLLDALADRFGLAAGAEVTLELDPASFDQRRLAGYLALGINRVSLGGQSFDDVVLAGLGRRHRGQDLRQAADWLRQAQARGTLRSWSLDLIQGAPLDGPAWADSAAWPAPDDSGARPAPAVPCARPAPAVLEHWRGQLEQAIALQPPHLSIYDLTIEPGTAFERWLSQGRLRLPDDEVAADLHALSRERLVAAGYGHYEISNYAWPGHASRHNRVYWSGASWWGFGMGASSGLGGERLARPRNRESYGQWLADWIRQRQGQPDAAAPRGAFPLDERLMVGLRRREGVNLEELWREHGLPAAWLVELRQRLASFEASGLLRVEGPRWRLSDPEGLALSNAVLRDLLAWWQRRDPRVEAAVAAGR